MAVLGLQKAVSAMLPSLYGSLVYSSLRRPPSPACSDVKKDLGSKAKDLIPMAKDLVPEATDPHQV